MLDHNHSEIATPRLDVDGCFHYQWLMLTVYSVASGFVAFTVGAIVSLAASATSRLTIWVATTVTISVAAGIARESRLIISFRHFGHRLLRRLVQLSPIS
jgi:hypothetical protein